MEAGGQEFEPRCTECGYLRTGLGDDEPCPECGVEWGAPISVAPRRSLPMPLKPLVGEDGSITFCNRGIGRATGWIGAGAAFLLLGVYLQWTREPGEQPLGLLFIIFGLCAALVTCGHALAMEWITIAADGAVFVENRRLLHHRRTKSSLDDLGLRRCRIQVLRSRAPMYGLLLAAGDDVLLIAARPAVEALESDIERLPAMLRQRINPGWLACSVLKRPPVFW